MKTAALTSTFDGWSNSDIVSLVILTVVISSLLWQPAESSTECTKRQYLMTFAGTPINSTIQCSMYFQWTVSDFCCYSKFDRYDNNPYCCYSDSYKLLVIVGLICGTLIAAACLFFTCWAYDIPHQVLFVLTCGKFRLNNWLKRNALNGPYVDPSFYSGESFWSRRNAEFQPYPLRPMPPRIFYPAAPAQVKFRWDGNNTSNGQIPLFVVASRQFTRNPYSARPSERTLASALPESAGIMSRRSSITTLADSHHSKIFPLLDFSVPLSEVEAATELLEALKGLEEKGDKALYPEIPEEEICQNTHQPSPHRLIRHPYTKGFHTLQESPFYRPSTTASLLSSLNDPFRSPTYSRRGSDPEDTIESLSVLVTPPATPYSMDGSRQAQRANIPYMSPKLPGSVPDS